MENWEDGEKLSEADPQSVTVRTLRLWNNRLTKVLVAFKLFSLAAAFIYITIYEYMLCSLISPSFDQIARPCLDLGT
jgi:hypothetical protein